MAVDARVVRFSRNGAPERVLSLETESVSEDLKPTEVLVRFLAAPISPADLAEVEGWDGRAASAGVGGNEGVGEVVSAGGSTSFKKGDWVVPSRPGLGTWRTHGVFSGDDLAGVTSGDLPPEVAATAVQSPGMALRLLSDFASLEAGDVIVQNNAASTVGQAVVQLAAARGIRTVNIMRHRDDHDDIVNHFHGLGADIVVDEDFARSREFAALLADLPAPKLGLNSVGGSSATLVARALGEGATLVSFGAVSRKPLSLPTSLLVSKDLTLRGFSLARWLEKATPAQRAEFVAQSSATGVKQLLAREPFADFTHALTRAQESSERKVVVVME